MGSLAGDGRQRRSPFARLAATRPSLHPCPPRSTPSASRCLRVWLAPRRATWHVCMYACMHASLAGSSGDFGLVGVEGDAYALCAFLRLESSLGCMCIAICACVHMHVCICICVYRMSPTSSTGAPAVGSEAGARSLGAGSASKLNFAVRAE